MKLFIFIILALVMWNARAETDHNLRDRQEASISALRRWHRAPTAEPMLNPTPWQTSWHINKKESCDLTTSHHRRSSDVEYICDAQKALKKVERN